MKKVSLVVDKDFGERLKSLVAAGPVWIVDTEANRKAAESQWHENPEPKQEKSVTTFKFSEQDSASEICRTILPMIDLHHESYSVLEVIGVQLNQKLRTAIKAFGFKKFESTLEGFRTTR